MTTFDKREEGFEKQFAHDEELKFKAIARRNKMLGLWAVVSLLTIGVQAAITVVAVVDQPAAAKSADSFVREIGWREFAYHLLHHYPHTPEHPLDERFERFPWAENPALLQAWQQASAA